MDDDRFLLDWARHYATLVALLVLAGVTVGLASAAVRSEKAEAWSILVQTEGTISPRQLGPTSKAIFRSEDVYLRAMQELGMTDRTPDEFLSESAELRPIPDTNALIVIGRADTEEQATAISDAVVRAFLAAVSERGITDFALFNEARPIAQAISVSTGLVLGGVAAFWLGLGLAALHYRLRRPVLILARAAALAEPRRVVVVRTRWVRLLGVLRPTPRVEGLPASAHAGATDPEGARSLAAVAAGGTEPGAAPGGAFASALGPWQQRDVPILAYPGTPERSLRLVGSEGELVWVD